MEEEILFSGFFQTRKRLQRTAGAISAEKAQEIRS
jgi:hypothetical protein